MLTIDGSTNVFGLIGNPVHHSLSPKIQNRLSEYMKLNNVYTTYLVDNKNELGKAVEGAYALGIKGLNITVPYKKDVIPFLSDIDEDAQSIGAVNTLKYTENGYKGYNTDIWGVIKTFEKRNISLKDMSILLIGAGGAAYSAAFASVKLGVKKIYILNRTKYNSELLACRIKKYYNIPIEIVLSEDRFAADGKYFIIQTTSVGMNESESPIKNEEIVALSEGVMDVIYAPPATKLGVCAKRNGKTFINGMDMLVYQAAKAFEIWNEIVLPEECLENLLK